MGSIRAAGRGSLTALLMFLHGLCVCDVAHAYLISSPAEQSVAQETNPPVHAHRHIADVAGPAIRPVGSARQGDDWYAEKEHTNLPESAIEQFGVYEVAPGVYVHPGRHVHIDHPHRDDIANAGFIVGERCVAVIDPGGSVLQGSRLREAIRARTDLPICLIFNTHVHFDHIIGTAAFVSDIAAGAEVVGHAGLAEAIAANQAFFVEAFAAEMQTEEGRRVTLPRPVHAVETQADFDLGARPLTATAYPEAHSRTDLTVLDRKTQTLFTGDLVFRTRIPALDGSVLGWRDALAKLAGLDVAVWVPGHGAPTDDIEDALGPISAYLASLERETRAAIQSGQSLAEAKDSVAGETAQKWELHEYNHARNVSRAFRELEWE